ncbi:antibiotic biosynthesis monooxygenase [Sphingomonas sp. DBB INV C78]|uniref:antibiotic biosynthesis monooxygenase family protein n=1 Tax=Sphingomonas sp. DBB INV C78 TaxID=3349434 RepID=UPI0036D33EDC
MDSIPTGTIAVIFVNRRTPDDDSGYEIAAQAMAEEASRQPGFVGIHSVRSADREGITVSYWADENAALAWKQHVGHAAIREQGRKSWYEYYHLIVAEVRRDYQWRR